MVGTDEYGTIRATDLNKLIAKLNEEPIKVQSFQYHLAKLCIEERGSVLEKVTVAKSRTRYKFRNPLFKAYVRLRYHQKYGK